MPGAHPGPTKEDIMSLARTTALALFPMLLAGAGMADSIQLGAQPAGDTITINSVSISADGWLVIHAMKDGKPVIPASIGHAAVRKGTTTAVIVTLDAPLAPGDSVLTMLHTDKGTRGAYEFPGPDVPVTKNDKPVVKPMEIK